MTDTSAVSTGKFILGFENSAAGTSYPPLKWPAAQPRQSVSPRRNHDRQPGEDQRGGPHMCSPPSAEGL